MTSRRFLHTISVLLSLVMLGMVLWMLFILSQGVFRIALDWHIQSTIAEFDDLAIDPLAKQSDAADIQIVCGEAGQAPLLMGSGTVVKGEGSRHRVLTANHVVNLPGLKSGAS